MTAADDPHGVARNERVHLTIENMMHTLALGNRWDLYVPAMFFTKNTHVNRMTGTTSFSAMFGRDPINVADATLGVIIDTQAGCRVLKIQVV
jgi:hypothetical protein